jgi:hypothetical protein
MADEAVITTLLGNAGDVVEFTVATGTAIPKGTLMQISASPQTAVIATAASNFAGIAATEKTTTDGVTSMGLITHCVCELTCGAAETMVLGAPVMVGAAANEVDVATGDTVEDQSKIVGRALETVGNNGTGAVLVNVGHRR